MATDQQLGLYAPTVRRLNRELLAIVKKAEEKLAELDNAIERLGLATEDDARKFFDDAAAGYTRADETKHEVTVGRFKALRAAYAFIAGRVPDQERTALQLWCDTPQDKLGEVRV